MNWKSFLAAGLLLSCIGAVFGCLGQSRIGAANGHFPETTTFTASLAGFRVRLVAVADTGGNGRVRLADHAWTPAGRPFEGAEAQLSQQNMVSAPQGGTRRYVVFEIEPPSAKQTTPAAPTSAPESAAPSELDAFAYLPMNGESSDDSVGNPGLSGPSPGADMAGSSAGFGRQRGARRPLPGGNGSRSSEHGSTARGFGNRERRLQGDCFRIGVRGRAGGQSNGGACVWPLGIELRERIFLYLWFKRNLPPLTG